MRTIFLLLATLLVTSNTSFAQGYDPATTKSEDFDDWKLEQARNEYWYNIRTSGEEKNLSVIEQKAYDAMHSMQNRAMFKSMASGSWQPIGGSQDGHNSGRIRGVSVDPSDPKIVYVAAASGGIWKTNDIDAQPPAWINLSGGLPTVNFGFIAIDPKNSNVIYAGTGESEGDNYREPPGLGIFKSTDAGLNWSNIASTTIAGPVCSQILIDSTNTQIIYVATGSSIGLLKSTDGGDHWKAIKPGVNPLSITYSTLEPNKLYVSGFGSIYRSEDAGENWTRCKDGLPTASVGRITVACAPTLPNLIYASIGNSSTRTTLGLYASSDYGLTWRKMSATGADLIGSQQEWCNALAVRPGIPRQIVVGGLDIYRSSLDSGKTYTKISGWNPPSGFPSSYVHADIHHLVFSNNSTLYACTDGGLAKSSAIFDNWNTELNQGLATLQFVGVDADKDLTFITGGCQDNGTNRAYINSPEFTEVRRGDGGRGWISPDNPGIVYTTYVYASFYQSLDSGKNFGKNLIENNPGLFKDPQTGAGSGEGAPFYAAYDVSSNGEVVAFGGNSHIWVSTSGGSDGFSDHKSDKVISAANTVHVSLQDPIYMWAGSGANIWRSADQGFTWVSKAVVGTVTWITSNPTNHNEVFVVTQGTGNPNNKHFYKSEDGGATFTSPATNLPDIGCWTIAFNEKDGKLFIGTDKGVLYSEDGGVTWNPLMNGMPYVLVNTLRIKGRNNDKLLAGTYGRGAFWLDLNTLDVRSGQQISGLSFGEVQPNPVSGGKASLNFTLPQAGQAQITLYDVLGREVKILDKDYYEAGAHSVTITMTGLTSGTYMATLVYGGRALSQKVVIE